METKFGFWLNNHTITTPEWEIKPVADFQIIVTKIKEHDRYWGGWVYPPLTPVTPVPAQSRTAPLMPNKVFALPSTHVLTTLEAPLADSGLHDFLISVLGLIEGLRLIRDGWTHFHRVAVETQKLSDIVCLQSEYEIVLNIAKEWWLTAQPEHRKLMCCAIHWRLFGSTYTHQFEQFLAQYLVLDSLFALHEKKVDIAQRVPHAKRPSLLANYYQLLVPSWATMKNKSCEVARLRNEMIHEAKFAGEPIGFAYPKDNLLIARELEAFNTRLIIAMLGVDCAYVSSPTNSRQLHGLGLGQPSQSLDSVIFESHPIS